MSIKKAVMNVVEIAIFYATRDCLSMQDTRLSGRPLTVCDPDVGDGLACGNTRQDAVERLNHRELREVVQERRKSKRWAKEE